jgi:hypothetical protein
MNREREPSTTSSDSVGRWAISKVLPPDQGIRYMTPGVLLLGWFAVSDREPVDYLE